MEFRPMNNRRCAGALVSALLLTALVRPGVAGPSITELDVDLRAERDELIGKLTRGEDSERSLERFIALRQKWLQRVQEVEGLQQQEKDQKAQLRADGKELDHVVGDKCELNADPLNPPTRSRSFMHADWGPVIDKQPAVIPARKPFDEDEKITLYKVKGLLRTYTISSKGPALWYDKPLTATVGDLVLICMVSVHSEGSGSQFPPNFRDNIVSQGFAVPIKEPPLITKKKDRNPVHFVGKDSGFVSAIHSGEWRLPPEQRIVSRVLVKKDLGQVGKLRRYAMFASEREEFVLEVPATLRNVELLQPFRFSWVIMGNVRFDRELKRLVLVAEDIEPRYVTAKN
jgi:hypothetical protein